MKCFYYFKRKSRSKGKISAPEEHSGVDTVTKFSSCSAASPRSIPELYETKGHCLRVFSFSELKQATHGFNSLLKIGEGGFGCVYKGAIKPVDGKGEPAVVAIKKLSKNGLQGHKQWVAEVQFLGVVEHPNLVKLVGYCAVNGEREIQRLLVYEFVQNKSLEDHLFGQAFPTLSWETRLRIMLGAAEGLAYLHEGLEVQVIYRDFKASNVLLDENFNPKLSDFGLAREGPMAGHTHVSTARRSLERGRAKPEQKLLDWVKLFPVDGKKFGSIMDPRLENRFSIGAARDIAKLANSCLSKSHKDRPKMSRVVDRLKQIIQAPIEVYGEDLESPEVSHTEPENKSNQSNVSESWKRRMAHLAKLGEHVQGASGRRLMMLQMAKVP
ncbi:hypothetical protein GOBAR_DD28121 [Gossypium barbadense]|nr:hypothetical protein GOBAR_DD28121 [Gossypium barbadense]